jgi:hypothetical protein
VYTSIQPPTEGQPKQLSSYKHVVKMHLRHILLSCKNIKSRFFNPLPGLTKRREERRQKRKRRKGRERRKREDAPANTNSPPEWPECSACI